MDARLRNKNSLGKYKYNCKYQVEVCDNTQNLQHCLA